MYWIFGAVIAGTLLALGMLFGAIAALTATSPTGVLESLSKIQGIVIAVIGFAGAGIAYLAQTKKVRSDEKLKQQEQAALVEALEAELDARTTTIAEFTEGVRGAIKLDGMTPSDEFVGMLDEVFERSLPTVQRTIDKAWSDLTKGPANTQVQVATKTRALEELVGSGRWLLRTAKLPIEESEQRHGRLVALKNAISTYEGVVQEDLKCARASEIVAMVREAVEAKAGK